MLFFAFHAELVLPLFPGGLEFFFRCCSLSNVQLFSFPLHLRLLVGAAWHVGKRNTLVRERILRLCKFETIAKRRTKNGKGRGPSRRTGAGYSKASGSPECGPSRRRGRRRPTKGMRYAFFHVDKKTIHVYTIHEFVKKNTPK